MGKFVFDDLTGIPTILATERSKRPDHVGKDKKKKETKKKKAAPKKKIDFFAKGNESMTPPTVYQDKEDWTVRVFPNKFPIYGDHEVIVHSPYLKKDLGDLPVEQSVSYIRALLNRVGYYTADEKEVFIFNNRGKLAGASLPHPHSQLIAAKGFPGLLEQEKNGALHYFNSHNSCYWCDMIRAELASGKRIIFKSPHFVLIAPKASRWSYEARLYPLKHSPNISLMHEDEIQDLGRVLKSTLQAYNEVLDKPERNFWIHTLRYEPYHWFFTFMPRMSRLAGLEIGAGIWVSPQATPEAAAETLKPVVKKIYSSLKK